MFKAIDRIEKSVAENSSCPESAYEKCLRTTFELLEREMLRAQLSHFYYE
jgi:hypothetical protein